MTPFLDSEKTEVITISLILLRKYGPDYIGWETETLRQQLESDYGEVGELSFQKACVAQIINAHDIAWKEWEVFEKVCAAINHEFPIFSMMQPPEPEDIAITLNTLNKTASNEYSDEVLRYITAACINDGTWYVEDGLSIINELLDEYYQDKGFMRDVNGVQMAIKNAPYESPNTSAQAQSNRVLSVRNVLSKFKNEIERERKKYLYVVKG